MNFPAWILDLLLKVYPEEADGFQEPSSIPSTARWILGLLTQWIPSFLKIAFGSVLIEFCMLCAEFFPHIAPGSAPGPSLPAFSDPEIVLHLSMMSKRRIPLCFLKHFMEQLIFKCADWLTMELCTRGIYMKYWMQSKRNMAIWALNTWVVCKNNISSF